MKNWQILHHGKTSAEQGDASTDIIQILLENRGLKTEDEKSVFLHPKLEDVTPAEVGIDGKQLKKTLTGITQAIKKQERIIVYGDYDVDGITGTAILWETLHAMGANTMPYIPHRVDEGYGLSVKGITRVMEQYPDVKLIITVDNGIVANAAVDFANENKIEVIITDHHVSSGTEEHDLPKAFSIVHTTKLCGAGVAWLLAKELRSDSGEDTHLELATLGTVADLVPLTGANRAIVKHGLKKLSQTKRKGLLALFDEAACDKNTVGVYQIGHVIGPRLNATGRMETAMDSLRLLCTKDMRRAHELAALLGRTNTERREVMFRATEHASLTIKGRETIKKLLFVADEKYPEGVIGLVAGRLVEEHYRPAIVVSRGEKVSKGSVRSVNGFNIIEFLRSASEYFVNVGGHPMAAGFTVETEKLEKLQSVLEEMAEGILHEGMLTRSLRIDTKLPFSLISPAFYRSLQQLAPFGMGNPEPTFMSEKVEVMDIRQLGKEGNHLKLQLQQDFGQILEAVAFGMGELYNSIRKGDLIDIVYTLDENTWNGNTKLQLKLKDIRTV